MGRDSVEGLNGLDIAVDSQNNAYITCRTTSYGAGSGDLALIKYDPMGNKLWNYTWGGIEEESGEAIVIDSEDNIYIGGYTDSFKLNDSRTMVLLKYNSSGFLIWDEYFKSIKDTYPRAISLDSLENVYVTGKTYDEALQENFFVVGFNKGGNFLWNTTWRDPSSMFCGGSDIKINLFNDIYVSGFSDSINGGFYDYILMKYKYLDPKWIELPTNQSIEAGIPFYYDVNATSDFGIDHYSVNDTSNFDINEEGIIYNKTILSEGIYWLEISAFNPFNSNCSGIIKINISDTLAPTIKNVSVSSDTLDPEFGGLLNISCEVYDFSGIQSITAFIESPDENVVATLELHDDGVHGDGGAGDGVFGNTWDYTSIPEGTYYIDFSVVDNSSTGNVINVDNNQTLTVTDNTEPQILDVILSSDTLDPDAGGLLNIGCEVYDFSGIQSITAFIESPDENVVATLELHDDGVHGDGGAGDGVFGNTWDYTSIPEGTYYIDFSVVDNSSTGNVINMDNNQTLTVTDNTGPQIQDISVDKENLISGEDQNIIATISDFSGINSVYILIRSTDDIIIANITLYDDGNHKDGAADDGIYGNLWDSMDSSLATYYIDLIAIDNSTNRNINILKKGASFDLVENNSGQFIIYIITITSITGGCAFITIGSILIIRRRRHRP